MPSPDLFDDIVQMPNPDAADQFDSLVGVDHLKAILLKEASLMFAPKKLEKWSMEKHGRILPCVEEFQRRPPLMIFSGDVGTGKTTLADSLGDQIARTEGANVTLIRLSLFTRGTGAVGQMTRLLSNAFGEVAEMAGHGSGSRGKPSAIIFVIDEADALAESRATEQMHHEDRAGVNTLIRGIDRLARERLPVLVILCTNRPQSLDPAVLRRAAIHHVFKRPNEEQRNALLRKAFGNIFDNGQYHTLVRLTGPTEERSYGYSFSDITQRLIPRLLLEAFPDEPLSFETATSVLDRTKPTRPFDFTGDEQKP